MKDPQHISEVIIKIASDPTDSVGKVICQCPCVKELLRRKIISLDDLSDDQIKRLSGNAFLEDWIDGQVVMQKLHISPRTLQTLRSNGTIPYTKIGHKIWYLRQDIEKVLRTNYIMFNIRERYGEDF